MLINEILKDGSDVYFLMTKSQNQHKLENTFFVLRQKWGKNHNPSVNHIWQIYGA